MGEIICTLPGRVGISHDEFDKVYCVWDCPLIVCELERSPDLLFEFELFALLIEVDENFHRYRTMRSELSHVAVILKYCEDKGIPLIVIRVASDGIAKVVYTGARLDTRGPEGGSATDQLTRPGMEGGLTRPAAGIESESESGESVQPRTF